MQEGALNHNDTIIELQVQRISRNPELHAGQVQKLFLVETIRSTTWNVESSIQHCSLKGPAHNDLAGLRGATALAQSCQGPLGHMVVYKEFARAEVVLEEV